MSFHRSSRGAPASGAEGGQIVQQQPQTQTISTNNCRKIFAQRDYSEGKNLKKNFKLFSQLWLKSMNMY